MIMHFMERAGEEKLEVNSHLAAAADALYEAQQVNDQIHTSVFATRYDADPHTTYVHRLNPIGSREPQVLAVTKIIVDDEQIGLMVDAYEPKRREPMGAQWRQTNFEGAADAQNAELPLWWYGDRTVYTPGQVGFDPKTWDAGLAEAVLVNDTTYAARAVVDSLTAPIPAPEVVPQQPRGRLARTLGWLGMRRNK